MKLLEERILQEGQVRPGHVLKVDCFLNHQLDVELLDKIGEEFKQLLELFIRAAGGKGKGRK